MTAYQSIAPAQSGRLQAAWRTPLAWLAALALAILVLFAGDAADMATIWWTSSTYSHMLFVPAIIAWLVWQRRAELAQLTPVASPWGLAIVALGSLASLLGEAAGVGLARHLGLVLMLQGAVIATLGLTVARGLLFPLFYGFFLVPFGEEFVPALQMLTARLSMWLLGLAGVPAHIEGVFITTPSGYFEVAEACSGVKFLVAMVALGALAANLFFKSWTRRIAFMALCVVVPIVANGIRAFGTIYIADTSGIAFAASFDHIFYGWIFFAIVIALVLGLGWRFFDRAIDAPAFDPAALNRSAPKAPGKPLLPFIAGAALALAILPLLWTMTIAANGRATAPAFDPPAVAGWAISEAPMAHEWHATYAGADRLAAARYRDASGHIVDLAIGYYAYQDEGRELVGFGQGGLPIDSEWSWVEDSAPLAKGRAYRITAPGPVVREVAEFNYIGGILTGSDSRAKLETLRLRLLGGNQRAIGITISAEGSEARAAIDTFLADAGGAQALVDRVAAIAD